MMTMTIKSTFSSFSVKLSLLLPWTLQLPFKPPSLIIIMIIMMKIMRMMTIIMIMIMMTIIMMMIMMTIMMMMTMCKIYHIKKASQLWLRCDFCEICWARYIVLYLSYHNIFNIFICIIIKYDVSAGTHEAQLKDRHMLWLVTLPPNKP